MREYAVTKCECEACEFDHALMEWTREAEGFTRLSEPLITTWRTVTGCSECMNRLARTEAAIETLTADINRLTDGKLGQVYNPGWSRKPHLRKALNCFAARERLRNRAQALRWVLAGGVRD